MFGELKGITGEALEKEVEDRLADVDLLPVQNAYSRTYSGGMRRRLSVAVALTGNPKVCVHIFAGS